MADLQEQLEIISSIQIAREGLIKQKEQLEEKINNIDKAIFRLWELFDICPRCNGEGRYTITYHSGTTKEKRCDYCDGKGQFNIHRKDELKRWMLTVKSE